MTTIAIDDAADPRIAAYVAVSDPELVRARGLFVAEGRLVVSRVIDDGQHAVRSLMLNEAAFHSLASILGRLPPDVPVYIADVATFRRVTGYNIHRGCLALVERPPDRSLASLLTASRTLVVLEAVANADNVGGVFRSAAALGADGVVLSPTCCDPFYRKAIRTSMGAALRVAFARSLEWPRALDEIRAGGYTIAALTLRRGAMPLDLFVRKPRPERLAIVAGSEGQGLSPAAEAAADVHIRIPIGDAVDSLNVGVAVAIALYACRPTGIEQISERKPRPDLDASGRRR